MKAGRIVKKIVKTLFFVLFAAFFAFLLMRIFILDDKRALNEIYPTDNMVSAYGELGADAFTYCNTVSEISSDGYYSAYGMVYCESRGELQLTVRFNDSLTEKYMPGTDPENFRWLLLDGEGNTISEGKVAAEEKNYQYNCRRVVFENTEIPDGDILLRMLCDEAGYPPEGEDPAFIVYNGGDSLKTYRLSRNEKKLLTEAN